MGDSRLRVLSPVSQSEENDLENSELDDNGEEVFEEAPDRRYPDENEEEQEEEVPEEILNNARRRSRRDESGQRWRRRVEQALTKLTAEIAAVREQLETQALYRRRRSSIWAWMKWLFWIAMRQILWDISLLGIVLIWFRLKGDPRLENRVRAALTTLKARLKNLQLMKRLPRIPPMP